jgi:hypothetical protein
MNVFLTYAAKDESLAAQLAKQLSDAGVQVLNPYGDIVPGDNWAQKVAEALEESDLMLILVTPGSMQSDSLKNDIDYALSSKKFRGRLMSVIVGPVDSGAEDVPWILLKQPHKQVESPAGFSEVVDELMALAQ